MLSGGRLACRDSLVAKTSIAQMCRNKNYAIAFGKFREKYAQMFAEDEGPSDEGVQDPTISGCLKSYQVFDANTTPRECANVGNISRLLTSRRPATSRDQAHARDPVAALHGPSGDRHFVWNVTSRGPYVAAKREQLELSDATSSVPVNMPTEHGPRQPRGERELA